MPCRFPFFVSDHLPLHIVLILFTHKAYSQDTPLVLRCYGDNYPSPSLYESSLHSFLANLTASVPNSPSFYLTYNATIGFPYSSIFALAQCRPDSSSLACSDCLRKSTIMVTTSLGDEGCGRTISAAVIFDMCIFHYTNQSFDLPDSKDLWLIYNPYNASSPTQFKFHVQDLLWRLSEEAATADSKFAVGFTDDGDQKERKIYGLVWCTRNLPFNKCEACLQGAMENFIFYRAGGQAMTMRCVVRFEIYVFFDLTFMTPASSLETIHRNEHNLTSSSVRGGDSRTKVLLFIAISEALALVLLSTIFIILILRMKKMFIIVPIKAQLIISPKKISWEGFRVVFMGLSGDGEEIAVKRLSKASLKGVQELENEVASVAKL